MGLFGFGKKKQDSVPVNPAPEPQPVISGPPHQKLIMVDGQWYNNPDYDPDAVAPESPKVVTSSYTEDVEKFLARTDDAKLVKLTGKPEDFAFYNVGSRCHVEEDFEKEKFAVTCDGAVIGYLPASAVTYAEKHETDPELLDVIIADIEYDIEKDRDIISVYIA